MPKATEVDRPETGLVEYVAEVPFPVTTETDEMRIRIARQIMAADTVEGALKPLESQGVEPLFHKRLTILSVVWLPSTKPDGPPVYGLFDAVLDTGEPVTFNCGGEDVILRMRRVQQLDGFPVPVRFALAEKPTAAGFLPIRVTLAPDGF
jgi:hypothetical protein